MYIYIYPWGRGGSSGCWGRQVFFVNLHNALMLHTHFRRRTPALESLKALRRRLGGLHQYQIGGKRYSMDSASCA